MMAICVKLLAALVSPGEVALVFVAGMADIEDLHTLFCDLLPASQSARLDILPFHSLLSAEETDAVFDMVPDRPKIILATNIAEASLTIKNVKFVVDFGVSKVKREGGREGRREVGREGGREGGR